LDGSRKDIAVKENSSVLGTLKLENSSSGNIENY
jgi:hypothetical protein